MKKVENGELTESQPQNPMIILQEIMQNTELMSALNTKKIENSRTFKPESLLDVYPFTPNALSFLLRPYLSFILATERLATIDKLFLRFRVAVDVSNA